MAEPTAARAAMRLKRFNLVPLDTDTGDAGYANLADRGMQALQAQHGRATTVRKDQVLEDAVAARSPRDSGPYTTKWRLFGNYFVRV